MLPSNVIIKEVWAFNLEEEMKCIGELMESYSYVGIDTEFPGELQPEYGVGRSDAGYRRLSGNVSATKMIQLGISLSDEDGQSPKECSAWQFNFKFDLDNDMYSPESIGFLKQHGMDFSEHKKHGIDSKIFRELSVEFQLFKRDKVAWISFQGAHDYAYLLEMLTGQPLPNREREFTELMEATFSVSYDVKWLLWTVHVCGGLNAVANILGVARHGGSHGAGSDSLLTLHVFLRILQSRICGEIHDSENGMLYGYGAAAQIQNFAEGRDSEVDSDSSPFDIVAP